MKNEKMTEVTEVAAIKQRLDWYAQQTPQQKVSPGVRGLIVQAFERLMTPGERHLLWGWLFDGQLLPLSIHDLTDAQLIGLQKWIGLTYGDGAWLQRKTFGQEALQALEVARRECSHALMEEISQ